MDHGEREKDYTHRSDVTVTPYITDTTVICLYKRSNAGPDESGRRQNISSTSFDFRGPSGLDRRTPFPLALLFPSPLPFHQDG